MKQSILLVDDKPEIAKIIMLYLSSLYDVTYRENPIKAIAWLNEGNIPDGYARNEWRRILMLSKGECSF